MCANSSTNTIKSQNQSLHYIILGHMILEYATCDLVHFLDMSQKYLCIATFGTVVTFRWAC